MPRGKTKKTHGTPAQARVGPLRATPSFRAAAEHQVVAGTQKPSLSYLFLGFSSGGSSSSIPSCSTTAAPLPPSLLIALIPAKTKRNESHKVSMVILFDLSVCLSVHDRSPHFSRVRACVRASVVVYVLSLHSLCVISGGLPAGRR